MTINNLEFGESLDEILEELRSQLHINRIQLLEKQPRESGNNIQVQCIYHGEGQERKPSAGIRKDTGVYHCFACGEIHDFPEFVSNCFGYDDKGSFGWSWLLKNFLTIQVGERKDVKLDYFRNNRGTDSDRIRNRLSNDSHNDFVSESELQRYRRNHSFWRRRGITDENIIELFDLGYDERNHSVTFPVRDIDGNCLFVARRSVQTKFFSYPEGVKKPLYGLYEYYNTIKYRVDSKEIIVVESMIDCILLWQSGHYAVALNGLGNDLQFRQLEKLPIRKLILATDNDERGLAARDRIKKYVKHKIFTEINFPNDVKDPGDMTEEERQHILDWEVM